MRRLMMVVLVLAVMFGAGIYQPRSSAQEASPEAVMPELTGDMGFLTYANFGTVNVSTLLAKPVGMNIFQLELGPGSSVAYPPGDPGIGAHLVEAGTLTLRGFDVDILVTRAPRQTSPDTTPGEILPAGAETRLQPGDGFLFPPLTAGEFRNDGTQPVILAISVIFPTDETPEANIATPIT